MPGNTLQILRSLADAESASSEVDRVGKNIWNCGIALDCPVLAWRHTCEEENVVLSMALPGGGPV